MQSSVPYCLCTSFEVKQGRRLLLLKTQELVLPLKIKSGRILYERQEGSTPIYFFFKLNFYFSIVLIHNFNTGLEKAVNNKSSEITMGITTWNMQGSAKNNWKKESFMSRKKKI
ncbi:UNVERIFIED_CONTAM: hypothetical protein K2H54_034406 [Gekko kuhli]